MSRVDVWIATVAGLNAISAAAGAVSLVAGALDQTTAARLPFDSLGLAAIALALVVAVPNAILAWLAVHSDPRTGRAADLVGLALVGWIVVEMAIIRELSLLQPLYAGVGVLLILLGRHRRRVEAATDSSFPDRAPR